MISDEKMTHIVHLMIDGIWKLDMVDFPDEDAAMKEAKRVCLLHLKGMTAAADVARQRILSQKSHPPEHSPQWETLYQKYYEEEFNKRGG